MAWLVVCVAALAAITAIGLIFSFVVSDRTSVAMTTELAALEFARPRARFADEQPLLDMSRREGSGVATRTAGTTPLRSFHTAIFDTRGSRRLVRIDVSYWFVRRFADRHGEFRRLGQSSLDDIERHGPSLIADYRRADGGQFISWLE